MNRLQKLALAATVAVGATAGLASAAQARVVCNGEGYCWHVRNNAYAYAPAYGVVEHPDNWRWGRGDHYRWREHAGRGYWRGGVWVPF